MRQTIYRAASAHFGPDHQTAQIARSTALLGRVATITTGDVSLIVWGLASILGQFSRLIRRHLTESQRAMIAAKIADMELGDNREMHRPKEGCVNLRTLNKASQPEAAAMMC